MAKFNAFTTPKGWIDVICGPMFAGKSEELLRRLNRMRFAEVEFLVFKPKLDTRTSQIKSRDGRAISAIEIDDPIEIFTHISEFKSKPHIIAIDEAQFFTLNLKEVCTTLANNGYIVLVAGLEKDFRGESFGPLPEILTHAEHIHKLTAICTECGAPATMTQRLINHKPAIYDSPIVLIGNTEAYTARCRHHHEVPGKPKTFADKQYDMLLTEHKR